jgi:hypothetical protein
VAANDDLVAASSIAAVKSAGKVRMEGKDYVMADGEVVESAPTCNGAGQSSTQACSAHTLPNGLVTEVGPDRNFTVRTV